MKAVKKTRQLSAAREQELDSKIKELSRAIQEAGVIVRREKLKQGPGWKVMSGECQKVTEGKLDQLVFVDRKSPLEDQLLFLRSVAARLNISEASAGDQAGPAARE